MAAAPTDGDDPQAVVVSSAGGRLAPKTPAGRALQVCGPAQVCFEKRKKDIERLPAGCEDESVDVPPPCGLPRRFIVETLFQNANGSPRYGEFTQWDEGDLVRWAYEASIRDGLDYIIFSITDVETGLPLQPDLDQHITCHLCVIARLQGPPNEPAPARSSRVRARDPEPELESGLPPVSRRRQGPEGDRGSAGDQPSEPSSSERPPDRTVSR